MSAVRDAHRPEPDALIAAIADYALRPLGPDADAEALDAARLCLMDSVGCMMLALNFPACARLLGPVVFGTDLRGGARVPGTDLELDPVQAAFNIGLLVRWLDYNDTWLAAEWGHPSDNLGAILACADYLDRIASHTVGAPTLTVGDLLSAMIKAHEIQGLLALENAFNRAGLDHVLLVRVASAAVASALLGASRAQTIAAVANAWIDGGALRAYRHAPNTGSRKSWAAGDASSRGVRLALLARSGIDDIPSALSAQGWGFCDALFKGQRLAVPRPFGSYVMRNVLFKVAFPAEFHAQTAVEAAIRLHPAVVGRLDSIERIVIETQQAGARIIDKVGPLANPADRDHCIQYMVAVALLHGALSADDYEDAAAADPRIDALRARMTVVENPLYSRDYLDPEKRSIANAVQVFFAGAASPSERVEIHYPLGHRRRRAEALPLLRAKFASALATRFPPDRSASILDLFSDPSALDATRVERFMGFIAAAQQGERATS